jgi:hypothetical protein
MHAEPSSVSQAEDPGQRSSYWFYMAALGRVYGDLLCSRSREFRSSLDPPRFLFLGLLFLILRHQSTLAVVGHRILGFLYEAELWYSTRALVYRRGASWGDRYHCTR